MLAVIIYLFVEEIYYLYSHFTNIHRSEISTDVMFNQVTTFGFLLTASFWLKRIATIITINTDQNTIAFTNFFTKQSKTYSFTSFDGYIQTVAFNAYNTTQFKVLCLLKNKVVIRKISGAFYANIEELEEGLHSLNYLGFKKFGIGAQLKIFFKQPVLD